MADPPSNDYGSTPYKDDPDEDFNRSSNSVHSDHASSTARHIELTQRTNELLSNFGNFLNELGTDDNAVANSSHGNGENGEFGTTTALQTPRSSTHSGSTAPTDNLSPFQRSYTDRQDDVSYEPAGGGQNLWNTQYYDYDADRKKLYRYRMFGGNNMAYVCTFGVIIALVVIAGVSIGGKNREKAPPTTVTVSNNVPTAKTEEGEVEDLLMNLDKSYMPKDPEMKELYLAVAETFRPKWFNRQSGWEGQAYLQAYEFCSSQDNMQPCPYMAICPGGQGNPPYGGVKERPDTNSISAWAPVKNVPNEWVQISYAPNENIDGDICQLFSTSHNGSPRWGLTGEDDEGLTQNILCCLVDENIMNDEPEVFTNIVHDMSQEEMGSDVISRPPSLEEDEPDAMVENMQENSGLSDVYTGGDGGDSVTASVDSRVPEIPAYWYSRSDGWEGTTYESADKFCDSQGGKNICPFQLYCPDGPGGLPFAASAQQALLEYDSLFWSPVMNGLGEEAWAGIGSANRCVPPLPHPRVSPEMLEQATSFIMCCDMTEGNSKGQGSSSATVQEANDSTAETTEEIAKEIIEEVEEFSESEFMKAAKEVWDPRWFSSDDGWNGGSFAEAIQFCNTNLDDGELCTYQAICPNGVASTPYMSAHIPAAAVDQWVPTRTNVFSYILISHGTEDANNDETLCDSYQNIKFEQPVLGTTSEMKEQKKYLLCCHHYSGE